ncbi:hypothetical protein CVT26_004513, partial [Gymnopilus dilepis]
MTSPPIIFEPGFSSLNAAHEQICASFLGPRAENHKILSDKFADIVKDTLKARKQFFPDDPVFIDEKILESPPFKEQVQRFNSYFEFLSGMLAKHCIPFFSPRYNGHMVTDPLLPATLGYLVGLLWNQNNVTPEASPLTSLVEYRVGQQICRLLGYGYTKVCLPLSMDNAHPIGIGWGHITCDGTVANLESMCVVTLSNGIVSLSRVARNLKYYPLSLQRAVKEGRLSFVAGTFETTLCTGIRKKIAACSPWELLNLTVDEILDLPTRLVSEYGISTRFIEVAISPYLVGNTGKDVLEKYFNIKSPVQIISIANHYSWPKSAAITGIGVDNLIRISVDQKARMNIASLRAQLQKCLEQEQGVYAVVTIMGTTEHGAVDPLSDVIQLRKEFKTKGLSFYVHADAAWGGYFCAMLPEPPTPFPEGRGPLGNPQDNVVLKQPLSRYTQDQLFSIRLTDSCTIDPHKAGFVPYPAGSLCYRDERLRFMVTMTAAYINTTADLDSVGTYGVEGSKPGAAATAVWLAHNSMGVHQKGYGSLLGEAMFTSAKLYANWVTMSHRDPTLITPVAQLY